MSELALITWVVTALGGLFLLTIWLIEYDPDFQRATTTRLPVPVITGHALLALCGLATWVTYLITDDDQFAWLTLAILAAVVTLGLTMATRWLVVYRSTAKPAPQPVAAAAGPGGTVVGHLGDVGGGGGGERRQFVVPPERHFPVAVVIGHGVFAATTVVLVLLTTLNIGGS